MITPTPEELEQARQIVDACALQIRIGVTEPLIMRIASALHEARPQWQPIESAPKDGTELLFYTPECPETGWLAFVAASHYDKHGLNGTHVSQWQDGLEPTHWMPLPPPPE